MIVDPPINATNPVTAASTCTNNATANQMYDSSTSRSVEKGKVRRIQ